MSEGKPSVEAAIEQLLNANGWVTSGTAATATGVSRQTAHVRLRAMADRGELVHEGAGRGARYRRKALLVHSYEREGLEDSVVWCRERAELDRLDLIVFDNPNVKQVLNFAFTEMLNNAIDHSKGSRVETSWLSTDSGIAFEVNDDGIGAFQNMAAQRGLADEFDAIGEIAKGKQTTAPKEHSGLGIYFTSRMANRFVISSGRVAWTVDNRRDDSAIAWLPSERRGTHVRCEVDGSTTIVPAEVFRSTLPRVPGDSSRSSIRVSLFERDGFVSRTEAKRLAAELETYGEVEVDFEGVNEVGQGFIDELFRVWQREHPDTRLVAINTNPGVDALLRLTAERGREL
jgi:anti-sigma regulatory factor (Ser/Thr protein kinase)